MTRRTTLRLAATFLCSILVTGVLQAQGNAPVINSLSPTSRVAGSGAFDLIVNGENFRDGATVHWRGAARTTHPVSATQLRAEIRATDITQAGSATVTVRQRVGQQERESNSVDFTITSVVHPTPTITSLDPATRSLGGAQFTLTVNGTGFLSTGTNTVQWKGQPRPTDFVSANRLTATIPASDLTTVGDAAVTVETRAGTSTRTSTSRSVTVLATVAVATVTLATTPISLTRFHIGGANNPERVFVNQATPLYAEHSGFPAPTHWKSSIDDGRALRAAAWQSMSTAPRHTFTTTGEASRLFQYRRIAGTDTTVSNVGRDAITVRPAFSAAAIAPPIAGSKTSNLQRRLCRTGEVMTGIEWRQSLWVDAVGVACAGRSNVTLFGNTTGGTLYSRICTGGMVPVPLLVTPPARGTIGPGFLASLMGGDCDQNPLGGNTTYNPLYAAAAAGLQSFLGVSQQLRCPDGGFPIGLDVYLDQVLGATGVKGIGLICAVRE